MKKFSFRAFRPSKDTGGDQGSSSNEKQAVSLKRREQVRKAQRTHRERKEVYIKSLETEVLHLRTNEANLLQEARGLYAEINQLRRLLTEHGVQLPPGNINAAADPANNETAALVSNSVVSIVQGSKGPQIHIGNSNTDPGHSNSLLTLSSKSRGGKGTNPRKDDSYTSNASSGIQSPASVGMLSSSNAYESALSATSPESTVDFDINTIGVEFVLTLESPCLGHIQGNPKEPEAPSGHVLTASAPLLFRAPSVSTGDHICNTTPWEAPSSGLERLLNLSHGLELDGEVTPVQAWNYIRQHPRFQGLDMEQLRDLTRMLLNEVRCYGFGAVVEQGTFENLVSNTLNVGRGF